MDTQNNEPIYRDVTPRRGMVVIDDHPLTRYGLKHLIENEPGLTFLGEADSPQSGLALVGALQPAIAIVDLVFAEGSGLDLLKDLRICSPLCNLIVYSELEAPQYPEQCLRIGARAYVGKSEPIGQLRLAIDAARAGRVFVSEGQSGSLLSRLTAKKDGPGESTIDSLSDAEFAILHLIAQGLSSPDIAKTLNRSLKTIETHRYRIKRKLGITNGTQLAQSALRLLREDSRQYV